MLRFHPTLITEISLKWSRFLINHLNFASDNMGSSYQSKHCAWYYFMVTGLPQGCVLRIQIVNTSNHSGLYKFDMVSFDFIAYINKFSILFL